MRKVCIITGYRSDYTKLKSVIKAIQNNPKLEEQVVVIGNHMSEDFGSTIDEIIKDGIIITERIHTNIEGNDTTSMFMSIAKGIILLTSVLQRLQPDIVLLVGDRHETLASAISASLNNFPIAHIQGGEITGTIDESLRHAITKMAHIHFPSTEASAERIIKMGENPKHVFNVGCPSIDYVKNVKIQDRNDFLSKYFLKTEEPYILFIQHPVTTELKDTRKHIDISLKALMQTGIKILSLYPNSDSGSNEIIDALHSSDCNMVLCKSVPQEDYFNLLALSCCLVGNSSSGIREAFLYGLPVVNIGTRQDGKERGENVSDVDYNTADISRTIAQVHTNTYPTDDTTYGTGGSGEKIASILSTIDLSDIIQKVCLINEY